MYDDKHMLKVVQHATVSALNNHEATATFLLLPNWMDNSTKQRFSQNLPKTTFLCQKACLRFQHS
jgi:hypothetical protein